MKHAFGCVVSDAGPLIGLAIVNALPWLQEMFSSVLIPKTVATELCLESDLPGAKALALTQEQGWLQVRPVGDVPAHLLALVDQGEAEAIALAKQEGLPLLIDEYRGRMAARSEAVSVFGTGAVLVRAKEKQLIPLVGPYLDALTKAHYRISERLKVEILVRAGELGA